MTDLTKLLAEVQNAGISHVDMQRRLSKGSLQWFLEKDKDTHPIHNRNRLEFFMGGQEGFGALDKDIRAAGSTIDIVLWGFDPGMELVRQAPEPGKPDPGWPRGTTYGDLLSQKARAGVTVRMLLWYDAIISINLGADNVHDLPVPWWPTPGTIGDAFAKVPEAPSRQWLANHATTRAEVLLARAKYCKAWWKAALMGRIPNLEVRMRHSNLVAITANIARYLPDQRALTETASLKFAGTHHQKPVLIDYQPAPGKTLNSCGYVMGLNSVTDYWDTTRHLYNDPQREISDAGLFWANAWHRKPYRDYAIRVQGESLYSLNENFVQGWDGVPPPQRSVRLSGPLQTQRQSVQPKDMAAPLGSIHRAQILRTQPEKKDATILKAYTLAASNALNYIYVENQYFQLADWPRLIKDIRGRYCEGMNKAGCKPADAAPLHLFIVVPQPERDGMVPRTYEAVGQLDAGERMGTYHQKVQGVRKGAALPRPEGPHVGQPGAKADYDRRMREWYAKTNGAHNSATVHDSINAVPANPRAELEALGIRPLVAMLMSFDASNEAKDLRIKLRDNNAQTAQAGQEVEKSHGKASDIDSYGVDIIPKAYREIYIHSKLMLIDDVYTTLGSANLNARSMVSDSELNICTDDYGFTQAARKRVWGNLAGADLDGGDGGFVAVAKAHSAWVERMNTNKRNRKYPIPSGPENNSFIHPFEDPRGEPIMREM